MRNGSKNHKIFEIKTRAEHRKKPLPRKGEEYEFIIQEKLLYCNNLNIRGKPDLIIIKGTAYQEENDKRDLLIIDKKARYNKAYHYQLWGYAYLTQVDRTFEEYKPFKVSTGFAIKQDYEFIEPFKKDHLNSFIKKLHQVRKSYKEMLRGVIPSLKENGKCSTCPFRDKCFTL